VEDLKDPPKEELPQFSSVEDWQEHLEAVKAEREKLDTEFANRRFDEPAKERFNTLTAEIEEVEKTIVELDRRAALLVKQAEKPERIERAGVPSVHRESKWTSDVSEIRSQALGDESRYLSLLRDNAMHMVEKEKFPNPSANREDTQAHIHTLLDTIDEPDPSRGKVGGDLARRVLMTGNPAYRQAFRKALVGAALSTEEQNQLASVQRALSTAGSGGGFALVYNLDPTVVPTSNFSVNPWRGLARVESISGTNEYKFVTSGAITAAYGAEAAETSDNAPTLAQPDIIVEKAQAFVPFSVEIGQDWGALDTEMAALLQDAKDDLEATKFATGAGHGSTEPKGVITGATNTVGTTTTAAFVLGDVFKLFEALAPRFRPRAQFVANLFIIDKIRQFGSSDALIWMGYGQLAKQADAGDAGTYNNSVGVPLLGRAVYESTAMGAVLTTTTKILIVGDFRYFVIVDRIGMNIELVPTIFGTAHRPTGQRGLYAYWRNSSDVLSAAAFQVLVT
jgi:HK97 family phage major capsid protein